MAGRTFIKIRKVRPQPALPNRASLDRAKRPRGKEDRPTRQTGWPAGLLLILPPDRQETEPSEGELPESRRGKWKHPELLVLS